MNSTYTIPSIIPTCQGLINQEHNNKDPCNISKTKKLVNLNVNLTTSSNSDPYIPIIQDKKSGTYKETV